MSTRWFPTLTGVKVDEDRSLPYKLIDAIFQLFRKLYDLDDRISSLTPATISQKESVTIQAKRAQMNLYPAADYALGSEYIITDWNNVKYVCQMVDEAHAWVYLSGVLLVNQSALAGLSLGAADTGLRVWIMLYRHLLYWNGTAWQFDAGDIGSAYVQMFAVAPTVNGWKLLDGTGDDGSPIGVAHPIQYLKSDGTLGQITALADLTAGGYLKAGAAFTGALNAAAPPSVTVNPTIAAAVAVGTGGLNAAAASHAHATNVNLFGDPVANMAFLPYLRK